MNKCKCIGTILAIVILLIVYVCNAFLYHFGVDIDLSVNRLDYSDNFILILLLVTSFLLYQLYRKNLIFFVISTFILQNLLISGLRDLDRESIGDDFYAHLLIIVFPISTIGIITWGIIFDFLRNKINKNDRIRQLRG